MKERLQKIIAASGVCSRRAAEELIKQGRVTVNGITAELGESADTDLDRVCVDGRILNRTVQHTYIMLNKPKGYVTTMSDEKGRPCVSHLVKDVGVRLYPVGRLDMYSEGLIIMTDDGELANRLMHPSREVNKTYEAHIKGRVSDEAIEILQRPLVIDGYRIRPAAIQIMRADDHATVFNITIHEGRNRQVRKMCEKAGLKLYRLIRISEGALKLGDLKPGHWRYLSDDELQGLKQKE